MDKRKYVYKWWRFVLLTHPCYFYTTLQYNGPWLVLTLHLPILNKKPKKLPRFVP